LLGVHYVLAMAILLHDYLRGMQALRALRPVDGGWR
jgi:hypothetical protein